MKTEGLGGWVKVLGFWVLLLSMAPFAEAARCPGLSSDADFLKYFTQLKQTNPLLRPHLSFLFEMSPCEAKECGVEGRHQRLEKREVIHLVREEGKKRIRFLKGPNAPQCILRFDQRDLKCLRCDGQGNQLCRVYQTDESTSRLQGTNIDEADFDFMTSKQFQHSCELVKEGRYLKLASLRKSGPGVYTKVETYVEAKRSLPILVRYFNPDGLIKLYRFFPQYYLQTKQGWISAWFQVRSVTGHEQRYHFETTFKLLKAEDQRWNLFFDLAQDPMIGPGGSDGLFLTK